MSDLDDRLKEIIRDARSYKLYGNDEPEADFDEDELLAAIKQAFEEAGYVQIIGKASVSIDGKPDPKFHMTGQEWYDRYVNECLKLNRDFSYVAMLDAAKRAAGLS